MSTKILFLIAFSLTFSFALCGFNELAKCPNELLPLKRNFQKDRYLGTWHLINRIFLNENQLRFNNVSCVHETYTQQSINPYLLDMHYRHTRNGKHEDIRGAISVDPTFEGLWNFYMVNAVYRSRVVATDYENWTVDYFCGQMDFNDGRGLVNVHSLAIRSRTRTMLPEVRSAIETFVVGLLDPREKLQLDPVFTDQNGCE